MMGACKRMGVWVGVGMSAIVLAIPACLLLAWVAMGCMWVLGILSVMKLVLRLMMWIGAEGGRMKKEKKKRRAAGSCSDGSFLTQDDTDTRLPLFQQYLEDQLNTLLAHQLLHVCRSDSLPNHVHLPLHVDRCDSAPSSHVDDQGQQMLRS